jgi:hypothetical protein
MFESESDRQVFTQDGDTAILTTGSVSIAVTGFFNRNFGSMFGSDVEGREITFVLSAEDAAIAVQDSELLFESITYTVVSVEPKGDGKFTQLILRE